MYRSSSKGLRIPFAVGVDGKIVDLKIGDYLSSHGSFAELSGQESRHCCI